MLIMQASFEGFAHEMDARQLLADSVMQILSDAPLFHIEKFQHIPLCFSSGYTCSFSIHEKPAPDQDDTDQMTMSR
jgi:hypothetical protein